jgi:hypothetical protein
MSVRNRGAARLIFETGVRVRRGSKQSLYSSNVPAFVCFVFFVVNKQLSPGTGSESAGLFVRERYQDSGLLTPPLSNVILSA